MAKVLLALAATNNVRVQEDVVEAAKQMPAELADALAEAELPWFASSSGPFLNYPLEFVDLGLISCA